MKTDDSLWEVETRKGERVLVVTLVKASRGTRFDYLLRSEARPRAVPRSRARRLPLRRGTRGIGCGRGWCAHHGRFRPLPVLPAVAAAWQHAWQHARPHAR